MNIVKLEEFIGQKAPSESRRSWELKTAYPALEQRGYFPLKSEDYHGARIIVGLKGTIETWFIYGLDNILICPECNKGFRFTTETSMKEAEGCTLDCPHCKNILIVKEGTLKHFHKWLHSHEPEWPADGEGTQFIEV